MSQITDLRKDEVLEISDSLTLDTPDSILVEHITRKINQSEKWYESERSLKKRQKLNEEFYLGKYGKSGNLKRNDQGYRDNVIWEAESTIKPIAMSRMPDLLVKPGNDTPESKESAKKLTDVINSDIQKRQNRRVLNIAFKHNPIYFFGCIKCRWNPKLGKHGDYEFYNVHPSKIIVDHNCRSNDLTDAEFVSEEVSASVKEWIMRFPKKKDELLALLQIVDGDPNYSKKLSTKIQVYEVHFIWFEDVEGGYTPIHGVAWKYKSLLLGKMKDPNWDWEGDPIVFQFDGDKKKPLTGEQVTSIFQTNVETIQEKVYRNYFDHPEFPYYIMGYDQLGMMPYDETSRIEQVVNLQKNIDDRGDQIKRLADTSIGRHMFSSVSGLKKEDLEELDMSDTETYLLMNGDINAAHKFIPGEQPSVALFNDLNMSRDRLFGKMGTNSTTRGVKESDTATTSQILREADFGRIDDVVEDTINPAAEWMARWALQMIKLRYTEQHMRYILGKSGETLFQTIKNDEIQNGMEIIVHASGVDKMQRKREAYERAKMQLTDPLSFFEDAEVGNPKERAERLLLFLKSPDLYLTKYVQGLETTEQQVNALGALPGSPQGNQQLTMDIALLQQGQTPQIPQPLDPQYVAGIDQFIQSPEFQALPPEIQQVVAAYAQSLVDASQVEQSAEPIPTEQPIEQLPIQPIQ